MQSTVDLAEEMSTKFQAESHSTEDMTVSPLPNGSATADAKFVPYVIIVGGVVGTLTNALVMAGLYLAGRSKMNVSSVFIANHTTLKQTAFYSTFIVDSDIRVLRDIFNVI